MPPRRTHGSQTREGGNAGAQNGQGSPEGAGAERASSENVLKGQRLQRRCVGPLHIFGLCNLALAGPVYDILIRDPGFILSRFIHFPETLLMVLALSVVVPGVMIGVALIAGLISVRARCGVLGIWVALLVIVYVQLALNQQPALQGFTLSAGIAAILGLALTGVLLRFGAAQTFLTIISALAFLLPANFLMNVVPTLRASAETDANTTSVRAKADYAIKPEATPDILIVVFDEFSLASLLTAEREIDAERYPHFAQFAETAVWYRNGKSVSPLTRYAIPSIVTGRYPRPNTYPTLLNYPDNLFELLAPHYEVRAVEAKTGLAKNVLNRRFEDDDVEEAAGRSRVMGRLAVMCEELVPAYGRRLLPDRLFEAFFPPPPLDLEVQALDRFSDPRKNRVGRYRNFVADLGGGGGARLDYLHILLPHATWSLLGSGTPHNDPFRPSYPGGSWKVGQDQLDYVRELYLLQVKLCDRLIGELVDRLNEEGRFESTLIVVLGDHGVSFQADERIRPVSDELLGDTLFVPYFIKYPGQEQGRVSNADASTIDIMPTIAEVLGFRIPWEFEGVSLKNRDAGELYRGKFFDGAEFREYSRATAETALDTALRGYHSELSTKVPGEVPDGRAGEARGGINSVDLKGRRIEELRDAGIAMREIRVSLEDDLAYENVDLEGATLPAIVRGKVLERGLAPEDAERFIVGVNGVVHAPVFLYERYGLQLRAILQEETLRSGRNEIDVYLLDSPEAAPPE